MADGILDFFSREAGQRRRRDLEDAITYYVPPELRGLLGLAAEANPVVSMERAGQDAQEVFAPDLALMDRLAAGGRMASNMAAVAAPAVVAGRAAMPAAQAVEEALLGFSTTPAGIGLMDFAAEDAGSLNLGGLYNALGRLPDEALDKATPFRRTGTEDFAAPRGGSGRAKDPALYTEFSSLKQDKIAPYDWEVTGRRLYGQDETPVNVTPERMAEMFDVLYGYPADATLNNVIIDSVNGIRLPQPILQQAGHAFVDRGRLGFASEPSAMAARNRAWREAQREGLRVGVTPMVMGPKGGDFSQHVGQTQAQLIAGAEGAIDPTYMPNLAALEQSGITGLLDPRLPALLETMKGGERAKFVKALDSNPAMRANVPSVAATRWATMDPNLIGAELLSSGYRVFEPAPSDVLRRHGGELHSTYTAAVNKVGPSMTMGAPRPWYLMFPDLALPRMEAATKKGANMPRTDALPKDLRAFQMNTRLRQEIDPEWVDVNARYDEIMKSQGKEAADLFALDALLARGSRRAR